MQYLTLIEEEAETEVQEELDRLYSCLDRDSSSSSSSDASDGSKKKKKKAKEEKKNKKVGYHPCEYQVMTSHF